MYVYAVLADDPVERIVYVLEVGKQRYAGEKGLAGLSADAQGEMDEPAFELRQFRGCYGWKSAVSESGDDSIFAQTCCERHCGEVAYASSETRRAVGSDGVPGHKERAAHSTIPLQKLESEAYQKYSAQFGVGIVAVIGRDGSSIELCIEYGETVESVLLDTGHILTTARHFIERLLLPSRSRGRGGG